MTRNKESRMIGKFVSQIRWEGDANSQRAAVLALKVGRYFPGGVRRCSITVMINHTDKRWKWRAAVVNLKVLRKGVVDSIEEAKEVIAALPDIWNDLRDYTIGDLQQGEAIPPKEPSWD